LYAMVCGYFPFQGSSNQDLCRRIIKGKFDCPSFMSADCKDLIRRMLTVEAIKRCSLLDVQRHSWCVCRCTCTCTHVYVYTHTHKHNILCVRVCVCVCVCNVCTRARACTHVYVYTHTQTHRCRNAHGRAQKLLAAFPSLVLPICTPLLCVLPICI
jgi:hypothetical protein